MTTPRVLVAVLVLWVALAVAFAVFARDTVPDPADITPVTAGPAVPWTGGK